MIKKIIKNFRWVKKAIEKAKPKKGILSFDTYGELTVYECPSCGNRDQMFKDNYCPECGQKIDWS